MVNKQLLSNSNSNSKFSATLKLIPDRQRTIICGDLNARALDFGDSLTNTHGEELWAALWRDSNAVRKVPGRQHFGGYLDPSVFDAKREGPKLGIETSEARAGLHTAASRTSSILEPCIILFFNIRLCTMY